jgi:hypothetical protein
MKTEKMKRIKLIGFIIVLLVATQSCVVSSLHPLYTDSDRVHLDELDGVWGDDEKGRYEIITIVDSTGLEVKKKKTNHKEMTKEEAFFYGNGSKKKNTSIEDEKAFFEGKSKQGINNNSDKAKIEKYFFNPNLRKHYLIKIITEKDTSVFDGKLSNLGGNYFLDLIPNDKHVGDKISGSFIAGMIVRTHGFFKIDLKDDELVVNTIENDDFKDLIENKRVRIEHVEHDDKVIITAKTEDIQKFLIKFANSEIFNDPDEALILKRIK